MKIPFTKAHGARNDFLLTWRDDLPRDARSRRNRPRDLRPPHRRRRGRLAADVARPKDADAAIELWNSDGSASEISGNGTRCAAAYLIEAGRVSGCSVRIRTGAGLKHLRLLERARPRVYASR